MLRLGRAGGNVGELHSDVGQRFSEVLPIERASTQGVGAKLGRGLENACSSARRLLAAAIVLNLLAQHGNPVAVDLDDAFRFGIVGKL